MAQSLKSVATPSVRDPWTCPTCNRSIATRYCPTCGENPLRASDLSLRGFLYQTAYAFLSLDGPLFRSLRCLLTRPGALTVAYIKGQRKPFTLPLPLFLVANVLFFAVQSLVGAKIFSTPLDAHLHGYFWSPLARSLVTHHLEARRTTLELYAPVFDQAVALNAKSLIVLMVLPFAAIPPVVFFRRPRPFVVHLVFALHFYAFLLLLFCIALAAVGMDFWLGGRGLESESFDHALSMIELAACAVYLYIATGTVYGAKGMTRVLTVVPLVMAAAGIVLGYRFVVMLITLYST